MYQATPVTNSRNPYKWAVRNQEGRAVAFTMEELIARDWADQMNKKGFIKVDALDLMSEGNELDLIYVE